MRLETGRANLWGGSWMNLLELRGREENIRRPEAALIGRWCICNKQNAIDLHLYCPQHIKNFLFWLLTVHNTQHIHPTSDFSPIPYRSHLSTNIQRWSSSSTQHGFHLDVLIASKAFLSVRDEAQPEELIFFNSRVKSLDHLLELSTMRILIYRIPVA